MNFVSLQYWKAACHSDSHILVWIKTVDYAEVLKDLSIVENLIDVISLFVIVRTQDIRTNPYFFMQRFSSVKNTQIVPIWELIPLSWARSKANQLENVTHFLTLVLKWTDRLQEMGTYIQYRQLATCLFLERQRCLLLEIMQESPLKRINSISITIPSYLLCLIRMTSHARKVTSILDFSSQYRFKKVNIVLRNSSLRLLLHG